MNYDELLNIKYKVYNGFLVLIILGIILTVYLFNNEVYDVYNTFGYINNNNLILNIPIEYSDTVVNGEYLMINDKKYNYEILNISEILQSNNINYQEVTLKFENQFLENMVLNTNIYHTKEKVFTKIKKIIVGG